jgi:hypothetical protein
MASHQQGPDIVPSTREIADARVWRVVLNLVVLAVAAHSIVLGVLLLCVPVWTLNLVRWGYNGEMFWPSQAGLFLIILGIAYAATVRIPAFVWLTIGSKAGAFVFLVASPALLGAPKIAGLMGCGDGLMGLAVAAALWRARGAGRRTRAPTAGR